MLPRLPSQAGGAAHVKQSGRLLGGHGMVGWEFAVVGDTDADAESSRAGLHIELTPGGTGFGWLLARCCCDGLKAHAPSAYGRARWRSFSEPASPLEWVKAPLVCNCRRHLAVLRVQHR